ncbi:MAG: hypothetical protein ACXV8O_07980 [Methylobacter sp.]
MPVHFTVRGNGISRWYLFIAGLATAVIGRRKWMALPLNLLRRQLVAA